MERKPSGLEIFVRRTLARQALIVGFIVAYGVAFPFFLFTRIIAGDGIIWVSAICGILAWWFAKDADKGLPIEGAELIYSGKKETGEAEQIAPDAEPPLAPSIIFRVITAKLALPIGVALAVGVSMLFWDFDGNIRRRGGFYRALVSVFGQEGTAIVLALFLGGLVFWWLNDLDEEIPNHQKEQVKKVINFNFLSSENYIKVVLTSILVVLIVIAFLLSSN